MKWSCLVVLFAVTGGGVLPAQTNPPPVAKAPAAQNAPAIEPPAPTGSNAPMVKPSAHVQQTRISSDQGEFDMAGRQVTYHGHVRVDDPEMKLTSEWLITDLPQAGEHVNHIVAETNVVIDFRDEKGRPVHATGDKAVYSYEVKDGTTNELVTLSGNAKVENADFIMTGEPIILNLTTRKITANNPVVTPRQSLINVNAGANSPPATNPPANMANPPATTHQPAADTNFPPGKLDLIPEPHVAPRNN